MDTNAYFDAGIYTVVALVFALWIGERLRTRRLQERVEQLEKIAGTDALTGIPNRRSLDLYIEHATASAKRHGYRLAVIMIDLDHFGATNKRHGHQFGDRILRAVVRAIEAAIRTSDYVGRYGGEEFAVIGRVNSISEALEVAERIRHKIESATYPGTTRQTASFGVAVYDPESGTDSDDGCAGSLTLARADKALKQAKEAGRNRVHKG